MRCSSSVRCVLVEQFDTLSRERRQVTVCPCSLSWYTSYNTGPHSGDGNDMTMHPKSAITVSHFLPSKFKAVLMINTIIFIKLNIPIYTQRLNTIIYKNSTSAPIRQWNKLERLPLPCRSDLFRKTWPLEGTAASGHNLSTATLLLLYQFMTSIFSP